MFGTPSRPAVMPMDAWREGDESFAELDLPGIDPESLDLHIERNVVTVKDSRRSWTRTRAMIAAERTRRVFSCRLFRGENLDPDAIRAEYRDGGHRQHEIVVGGRGRDIPIIGTASSALRLLAAVLLRHETTKPTPTICEPQDLRCSEATRTAPPSVGTLLAQ